MTSHVERYSLIECPWTDEFICVFSPCFEGDEVKLANLRRVCTEKNGGIFAGMKDGEIQGFVILEMDGDAGIIHGAIAVGKGHDLVSDYFGLIMQTFERWHVSLARFETFRKGLMNAAVKNGFRPVGVVFERAL